MYQNYNNWNYYMSNSGEMKSPLVEDAFLNNKHSGIYGVS